MLRRGRAQRGAPNGRPSHRFSLPLLLVLASGLRNSVARLWGSVWSEAWASLSSLSPGLAERTCHCPPEPRPASSAAASPGSPAQQRPTRTAVDTPCRTSPQPSPRSPEWAARPEAPLHKLCRERTAPSSFAGGWRPGRHTHPVNQRLARPPASGGRSRLLAAPARGPSATAWRGSRLQGWASRARASVRP